MSKQTGKPIETVPEAAEIRRLRRAQRLQKYGATLGRIVSGEARAGDGELWLELGDQLGLSDADLQHDRRVRERYAEAERIASAPLPAAEEEPEPEQPATVSRRLGLLAVPKQLTVEQQREHWARVGRRQLSGLLRRAREDLNDLPARFPRAFGVDAEARRLPECPPMRMTVREANAPKIMATRVDPVEERPAGPAPLGEAFEQGRNRWLGRLVEKSQA